MTEKELKSLPSFMAEDGSRRYLGTESDYESFIYDEYGRVVRKDYFGDIIIYTYDDENFTVTKVYFWADTGEYGKYTYEMPEYEKTENCFKDRDNAAFGNLNILSDESKNIMQRVNQFYIDNPDYYPEPEEMFSLLGLL